MGLDPSGSLSASAGSLSASLNTSGELSVSLSVPVYPGVEIGGTALYDVSNGVDFIGGSIDAKILRLIRISIGREGCTEFITISISLSPPRGGKKGKEDKGRNGNNRGNSRDNGKNDHGGRSNRNNRNTNNKSPLGNGIVNKNERESRGRNERINNRIEKKDDVQNIIGDTPLD
jgi:hypothetical protein